MEKRPLILVTNDDGISAPGIKALVEVVEKFGDVVVLAPDKPQSGMGHAITINSTLRINKEKVHNVTEQYSCSGTPVDCVKIAINKILPRKPDLIVSGINHGSNMSINVIYSGTMSAAVEGDLEQIVEKICKTVLVHKMAYGICLNVNIPKGKFDEIKGIKICRQAKANWIEELDERFDPSGKPYYWLTGKFVNFEEGSTDTDVWALDNNYVSVVPVQFDMTAHHTIDALKSWNL